MAETSPVTLCILSQPCYLRVVRAAVEAAGVALGLSPQEAAAVVLAVDEAVTNVIRHGYHGCPDKPIWVRLGPTPTPGRRGMQVVIDDSCCGADPSAIRAQPAGELRVGGLGVHIIKTAMDRVEITRRDHNEGLRLTLWKYAAGPVPAGAADPLQPLHAQDKGGQP